MTAIVKADHPLSEQWFMLATARPARPGWRILAARGDLYKEMIVIRASQSRSEALDLARDWARRHPNTHPGHLFVPINLELMALESTAPVFNSSIYVPMWPKRMPLCANATEARDRIVITKGKDKEFAAKWAAWRFVPVRVDDCYRQPE